MKNFLLFLVSFFLMPSFLFAQNTTTLTGTVTDSDGQKWGNAIWIASLVVPSGQTPVFTNGQAVISTVQGTLSSVGSFQSASIGNVSLILPSGSTWSFHVCSVTSAPCSIVGPITISGATFNLGSFLSPLVAAPRINASNLVYAYNSSEVMNAVSGSGFTSTLNSTQYFFVNNAWTALAGSGGGGAILPFSCIVYGTSVSGGSCVTSSQVVAAIGSGVYDMFGAVSTALSSNENVTGSWSFAALSAKVGQCLEAGPLGSLTASGLACPFSPQHVAGMNMFLNFLPQFISGSLVADTSGNNNNATICSGAAAPVSTNFGLLFNAVSDCVTLPSAVNSARTWEFAFYIPPSNIVNAAFQTILDVSINGTTGPIMMLGGWQGGYTLQAANAITLFNDSATSVITATPVYMSTGNHSLIVTYGTGTGDFDRIYYDGTEVANYKIQGGSNGLVTAGTYVIGSGGAYSGSSFQGTMYEVISRPTELSPANVIIENGAMQGDLAQRGAGGYGTYWVATGPNQVSVGDSITAGQGGTLPWPSHLTLASYINPFTIIGLGNAGKTSSFLQQSNTANAPQYCGTNIGPSIATIEDGTNDFNVFPGATGLNVGQTIAEQIGEFAASGCKVFVATMISRGTGAGNTINGLSWAANKNALNTVIRQNWKAWGAAGILDIDDPLLASDTANTNTTYFNTDGTHPTNAGYTIYAQDVSNAINYYFGFNQANPELVTTATYAMISGDGYIEYSGAAASTFTLPSCLGVSGSTYSINNQSTFAITLKSGLSTQPINGVDRSVTGIALPISPVSVITSVPNPPSTGGCHWSY